MNIWEFLLALEKACPGGGGVSGFGAGERDDELRAYQVVSKVVTPTILSKLDDLGSETPGATEAVARVAAVLESGFADGDDALVDALAMRFLERHLCREPARRRLAEPFLGKATLAVLARFDLLIAQAERAAASAGSVRLPGGGKGF